MCELKILCQIPGTEKKKKSYTQSHLLKGLIDKTRRNFVNFRKSYTKDLDLDARSRLNFGFFQETGENFIFVLFPR